MKTTFAKAWNFYREKQLLITIAVSVFLLFLSCLWQPFIYVFLVFLLAGMILLNVNEILYLTFFLLPFSGFLFVYIGSSLLLFLVVLVKYIIAVVKKQEKIYKLPLFITLAIIIVFSSVFYGTTDYGALQGVLIVCIFLFIYLVFAYRKQIQAQECLKYLLVGLTVSAAMGFILYFIPIAKMFSFKDWGYGLVSVKSRIFHDDGQYKRLELLSFHENHLYVLCLFGIVSVAHYFLGKNKKTPLGIIANLVGFGVCVTIGIFTLSKGFFVLLFLAILLFLVLSVIIHKKRSFIYVLPVVAIGITLGLIFKDEFVKVFERFTKYVSGEGETFESLFNSITTGRADIWHRFLEETSSTPLKALFGVGIFSADVVDIGPHNLYIAIIYRFGIFGTIALAVLAWSYIYSLDEKLGFSVFGLMPAILFLFLALQEACLDERLYFLVISVMLLFQKKVQGTQTNVKTEVIIQNSEIKGGK